jgi:NMD protein affecting ribosome stability and mRNA decay
MNNFTYTNGQPVKVGDIVHVRNRPYIVASKLSKHIALYSMDEAREYRHVFPQDIGARVANEQVHPTLRDALPW